MQYTLFSVLLNSIIRDHCKSGSGGGKIKCPCRLAGANFRHFQVFLGISDWLREPAVGLITIEQQHTGCPSAVLRN